MPSWFGYELFIFDNWNVRACTVVTVYYIHVDFTSLFKVIRRLKENLFLLWIIAISNTHTNTLLAQTHL
jgi:hypothetical protein